ncbi:stage II sporulation protein E [Streptomyces sp. 846.5]|nr:PP2C family protein-serine/threonine phosphatase [Streptomyces sp. 846.5]TDU02724.1 stage II sporulation protein E [Streptomyces sp. 846.5]
MPTTPHLSRPVRHTALFADRLLQRPLRRLALLGDDSAAAQQTALSPPPVSNATGAVTAAVGALSVAARYLAADSGTGIGGDFYAVQETAHGIRLLIGDVRGKGPGAGGIAAILLSAFRRAARQAATVEEVAARLDRTMERATALRFRADADEDFATALVLEISADLSAVRLVNCGHVPPLLLLLGGRPRTLHPRRRRPPLGLAGALGTSTAPADQVRLPRGATLLLLTDGVTEARSPGGEFYDPSASLAAAHPGSSLGLLLDTLCRDVHRHSGGPPRDDIAMLAVHRPPGPVSTRPAR